MALKLSDVVQLVKNQDWSQISNFSVDLQPINPDFARKVKWNNFQNMQKQIDISLKSIDVPQHSCATIEEYIGTGWRQANSRDDLFVCNLTFKDMNGGELYRRFKNILELTKLNYYNVCLFSIKVFLDSSFYETGDRTLILETNDALIRSVSQLQLSHENGSEILEFTVEFKFNTPQYSKYFKGLNGFSNNSNDLNIGDNVSNKVTNLLGKAIDKGVNIVSKKIDSLLNDW